MCIVVTLFCWAAYQLKLRGKKEGEKNTPNNNQLVSGAVILLCISRWTERVVVVVEEECTSYERNCFVFQLFHVFVWTFLCNYNFVLHAFCAACNVCVCVCVCVCVRQWCNWHFVIHARQKALTEQDCNKFVPHTYTHTTPHSLSLYIFFNLTYRSSDDKIKTTNTTTNNSPKKTKLVKSLFFSSQKDEIRKYMPREQNHPN